MKLLQRGRKDDEGDSVNSQPFILDLDVDFGLKPISACMQMNALDNLKVGYIREFKYIHLVFG